MTLLLLLAVLFLAASNGANDNFKGVAALYGSGSAGYRASLVWASVTTLAGSLCSVLLARALLKAFTGAGLVSAHIAAQTDFALAVAGGAGMTVALASWRGMPISTTHALVGAMSGAGLIAVGSSMHLSSLGKTFLLPLLASPLLAMIPALLLGPPLRRLVARAAAAPECVCRTDDPLLAADGSLQLLAMPQTVSASAAECAAQGLRPSPWRADARGSVRALLLLSSGAASFARGLNDTPKIAALLLPIAALDGGRAVLAVGTAMLVGGWFGARRVARTMSDRITRLDLAAALSASLTTALLVSTASVNGLPVSTTHVAVGALAGAGVTGPGGIDRKVMRGIAMSWIVTLPVAAVLGALLFGVLR
jgi:PiT family inorganic phosphate transporter